VNNLSKAFALSVVIALTGCAEQDPQQFIQEGRTLVAKGELKSARVQFKNAIQINPQLSDAYYELALLDSKVKDFISMRKYLQDVVRLDPNHVDARVKLGALLGSDVDKAKEHVAIALKLNANDTEAILLDASIKLNVGDKEGGILQLDRVFAVDKTNVKAVLLLSALYSEEKKYDKALVIVEQALAVHPDELNLYLSQIGLLKKQKKDNEVTKAYEILIAKFPDDIRLRQTQVNDLSLSGKSEQVKKALQSAITHMPEEISFKLALIGLVKSTDKTQAEELLQKYISSSPEEMKFKFRLVGIYISDKRYSEAQSLLKEIIASDATGQNGMMAKVRLAEISLLQNEKTQTEVLIAEILSVDDDNTAALLLRAGIRLDRRDVDRAISDLRIILRDQPESDQALVMMGRASIMKGESEVAESYWKKAIEANHNNMEAVVPLVSMLLKRGDSERAEELLVKSINASPGNTALVEVLVKLRVGKKDWLGVEEVINDLRQLPNGGLAAQMLTAIVAESQGTKLDAIQIYKDILAKQPNAKGALNAIARSYAQLGRNADFIVFMQNFIKENLDNIFAYNMLGQAYMGDRNWSDASKVLQQALELDPKALSTYRMLGVALMQQGKARDVVELYNKGLTVLPGNLSLMLELAKHYERIKAYDQAVPAYEKVISQYPDNEEAANNLAYILVSFVNDSAGIKRALSLVEQHKNASNPFFQDTYGWVLFKAGEAGKAVSVLKKVVETIPSNAAFRYHLAESYYATGDGAASKIELEKSITLADKQGVFDGMERAKELLKGIVASDGV